MSIDEEEFLRQAPLRAPSEALDHRIEALLAAPRVRRPRLLARPVVAWQCAAACVVCAAAAFLVGLLMHNRERSAPAMAEVRYVIQVDRPFDVFDWTKYPKKNAPCSMLRTKYPGTDQSGKI